MTISKKAIPFGLAAIVLVVLGVIFLTTDTAVEQDGLEGTVGAVKKYSADQIETADVQLGEASIQEWLQSDVYDRLLKDPQARAALTSDAFREALADDAVREALASDEFVDALAAPGSPFVDPSVEIRNGRNRNALNSLDNDAFRSVFENEALREALANDAFREALAGDARRDSQSRVPGDPTSFPAPTDKGFHGVDPTDPPERAAGGPTSFPAPENKPSNVRPPGYPRLDGLANDALRNAMTDEAFRAAMANDAFRGALANQAFRAGLRHQAFRAALANGALREALADDGLRGALRTDAFRQAFANDEFRGLLASDTFRGRVWQGEPSQ